MGFPKGEDDLGDTHHCPAGHTLRRLGLRGRNVRINVGPFGGTAEASIGPAGWALLADISNNGIVNLEDFSIFAADWLDSQENCPGDLTHQNGVTLDDLILLVNDWFKVTSWY